MQPAKQDLQENISEVDLYKKPVAVIRDKVPPQSLRRLTRPVARPQPDAAFPLRLQQKVRSGIDCQTFRC